MSETTRVGILGGTFDPIHCGHLEAAVASRTALSLDRVLLLPSRTPPHRAEEPRTSVYHRFAMTVLAASGYEGMLASDLELRRDGPSYTALTLEALQREGWSASQLFFIIGADAFAEIATWYDYPRLLDLASFAVVSRPGARLPNSPARTGPASATSVVYVDARTPDVSSTQIRQRVAVGQSIDGLVPGSVAEHIRRHHLYAPASATL